MSVTTTGTILTHKEIARALGSKLREQSEVKQAAGAPSLPCTAGLVVRQEEPALQLREGPVQMSAAHLHATLSRELSTLACVAPAAHLRPEQRNNTVLYSRSVICSGMAVVAVKQQQYTTTTTNTNQSIIGNNNKTHRQQQKHQQQQKH